MEISHWLVLLSFLLGQFPASADNLICQNFKFVVDEDVVPGHALKAHVFKNLTVDKVIHCHMMCKDYCRCISMNYLHNKWKDNCELNDVNKEMKPTAMKYKARASYYDLVTQLSNKCSQAIYSSTIIVIVFGPYFSSESGLAFFTAR